MSATKFSQKKPTILITENGLEGFDLSVKALVPYVRCTPEFFAVEIQGEGYFTLTDAFYEKLSKGFSAGTITITGNATIKQETERSVISTGEISIIGEGAEYAEPITLPEFPDSVVQAGTQLDYVPSYPAVVERSEENLVVTLKIPMLASGVMAIQDIASLPPTKELTLDFGEWVVASIKDTGRYSKNLPITYLSSPEGEVKFLANNKYFKQVIESLEGEALITIYATDKDSAIIFSQKTKELEYIFMVAGK
jgi:hypothetical protein